MALAIRAVPPALADALRRAAEDIGISQAAIVKLAIREWLEGHGYKTTEGAPEGPG